MGEELPLPEDGGAPPVYDWFVALELCMDVGMNIFELYELPKTSFNMELVQTWAFIRREALAVRANLVRSSQRMEQDAASATSGVGR